MAPRSRLFWPLFLGFLLLDIVTKHLAVDRLQRGIPLEVLGEVVRLTLSYNRGAAMGISLGDWSRPVFTLLALAAAVGLFLLYRTTPVGDRWRAAGIGMVLAGALGNVIDRVRWDRGVVDFLDVGLGTVRFWTFNVADIGVTVGVGILVVVLGREDGGASREPGRSAPDGG